MVERHEVLFAVVQSILKRCQKRVFGCSTEEFEGSADKTVQLVKVQEVHSHLACGGSSYRYLQLLLRAIALKAMKSVRGRHTATVGHWSVTHERQHGVCWGGCGWNRWDAYLIMNGVVEHRSIEIGWKLEFAGTEAVTYVKSWSNYQSHANTVLWSSPRPDELSLPQTWSVHVAKDK